jgi:hypothetical protein
MFVQKLRWGGSGMSSRVYLTMSPVLSTSVRSFATVEAAADISWGGATGAGGRTEGRIEAIGMVMAWDWLASDITELTVWEGEPVDSSITVERLLLWRTEGEAGLEVTVTMLSSWLLIASSLTLSSLTCTKAG